MLVPRGGELAGWVHVPSTTVRMDGKSLSLLGGSTVKATGAGAAEWTVGTVDGTILGT